MKKFKKVVILDTVIFYPEHRKLLNQLADEIFEYPSSLPEGLEKQYNEQPELFLNKKCYTQIASNNVPLQLLMNRIEGADVVVSCWTDIPDEILRLNPQLKLIIFWTHEKEHRINMELAKELGIEVNNIPDYGTDAVAEVVFAGLWQLLIKNHRSLPPPTTDVEIINAVVNDVFTRYRKLPGNEKYTRAGKFSHHFHKLGLVSFDFEQKNLDELIPEKMIEYKHIGLLNVPQATETIAALRAFGVIAEALKTNDSNAATYYKFWAENELVYLDNKSIPDEEMEKIKTLFGKKIVDIRSLDTSSYAVKGKVLGLVGLGRIAKRVAKIANGLGMSVQYYSRYRKENDEKGLGIKYVGLRELAETSDIISIHVPAHHAENLFNKELIASMKNGTIFINTADGNAIDQTALTERMLKNEIISYLDVYPGLPRKDILGLPMADKTDWKLHKELSNNVFAYRAGWKTQESIRVKTYKLLGEMTDFIINRKDE